MRQGKTLKNDMRLAINVTHYGQESYLSMVDCRPGRLVVCSTLRTESAEEIAGVLNEFCRGRSSR